MLSRASRRSQRRGHAVGRGAHNRHDAHWRGHPWPGDEAQSGDLCGSEHAEPAEVDGNGGAVAQVFALKVCERHLQRNQNAHAQHTDQHAPPLAAAAAPASRALMQALLDGADENERRKGCAQLPAAVR